MGLSSLRRWALGLVAAAFIAGSQASATPVLFSGNGHYYDALGSGMSWSQAKAAAEATPPFLGFTGHLATVTDLSENDFLKANFTGPGDAGTIWLGASQGPEANEPAGDWVWVTGEPWTYTHWAPGEPNNDFGTENHLTMYGDSGAAPGFWNDLNGVGYTFPTIVAEYDVPEPTSFALLGLIGLLIVRRPR